jgi:hypothetical protein
MGCIPPPLFPKDGTEEDWNEYFRKVEKEIREIESFTFLISVSVIGAVLLIMFMKYGLGVM